MAYLNHVTLMGNLTADIDLKTTPAGNAVASFTIAVNSKSRGGESRADFFDIVAWKGWAENLAKTARKGSLVLVEGRLTQERWDDPKTNGKRSRVRVQAMRALHMEAQYAGDEREAEPEPPAEGDIQF